MFGQDCGFCAERVGSLFSVAPSNLLSSESTKQSPRGGHFPTSSFAKNRNTNRIVGVISSILL
jgi:hypothetical protein